MNLNPITILKASGALLAFIAGVAFGRILFRQDDSAPAAAERQGQNGAGARVVPHTNDVTVAVPPGLTPSENSTAQSSGVQTDEEKLGAIAAQFENFDMGRADIIWLPRFIAAKFHWDFGDVDADFKMSDKARSILGITQQQQKSAEATVNQFLAEIRATEKASVQVVESTDESVLLKIPSGVEFKGRVKQFENDLRGIIGDTAAALLLPKLYERLDIITPLIGGKERLIRAKLSGDSEIIVEIQQDSWSSRSNALPEHLAHLLKVTKEP